MNHQSSASKDLIIAKVIFLFTIWLGSFYYLQPVVDFFLSLIFNLKKAGNNAIPTCLCDIQGVTVLTESQAHLLNTIRYFLIQASKLFLLLILIIFVVGIIQTFFTPERTRKALEGKKLFTGNILAGLLGIITPFCTCSAVTLFLGFVQSGIPLGVTFSFLIAAPMINEVAVILLFGLFGWKVAFIYILTGLTIAITAGYIIGKLKLEHWVADWVYKTRFGENSYQEELITFETRIKRGLASVKEILHKVWIYVLIGIGIGSLIHGYVPENFLVSIMDKSNWYSIPFSILIGIPLYSNAAGTVPIVSVLIEKGVPLGTALAFMMSVIGLSLPEMIILKKVLKLPLILAFVGIVGSGIMIVGYLFNFIL